MFHEGNGLLYELNEFCLWIDNDDVHPINEGFYDTGPLELGDEPIPEQSLVDSTLFTNLDTYWPFWRNSIPSCQVHRPIARTSRSHHVANDESSGDCVHQA